MKRIIPYGISYDTVNTIDKYASRLLYISTGLSVLISLIGRYEWFPVLKEPLIVINISFICLYAFLDQRSHYIFTQAEMKRRLDWLDHSFGTNFSGKKSEGYFTNESLEAGLKKLAVNCFENAHHTNFIISRMSPVTLTKTIILVLIFIFSSLIGDREIARLFFELSFPALLINKLIRTIFYRTKISHVYDRFKTLFNDLMTTDFNNKTAEALRDIVEYETTLAWASTPLDSEIFYKHKDRLAEEWEDLKKEYKIT